MPPDSWNPDGSDGALQPTPSTAVQRPQSNNSTSNLSSPSVSHEDQLDRQMLRHLMSRYSPETLARLMQEENLSPQLANNGNDGASVYTSSTYSSVKSDDAPSLFESSASSIRTLSDTSSARGSIISNVSAKTAKFLSRKTSDIDADSLTPSVNKQKGTFLCGFCSEEGIQKTCTRKNDLKRHIEDFHNTNAQWHCRQRGCGKVFDWQTVYKTHLKNAHGGSRSTTVDDARVELCQQTVFACGFANCIQVFEAGSDAESPVKFKEYVAHVVKHLDEGSNSGEWDYSTRIRNLMRQSGVLNAWVHSDWPEEERNRLTWVPQTSSVLRKKLETRHLGDLRMLVQYAIALGSNPQGIPEIHQSFTTPVRDECQLQIHGHGRIRINSQPAPPPPQHHHQHQQQPPQQQQEQDPFAIKISRGTPRHPSLANYYASHRMQQQFSARPAVRSGRSARPPVHTMQAHSMAQQQQQQQNFSQAGNPAPNMFDPNGFYHAQQQSPQPQQGQYMGMPSADGGIIADDLRSLRSMATTSSGHSNGTGDVDMADVMGDSSYLTQPQGYGMHNGPGVKMEDRNGFEYMGNY